MHRRIGNLMMTRYTEEGKSTCHPYASTLSLPTPPWIVSLLPPNTENRETAREVKSLYSTLKILYGAIEKKYSPFLRSEEREVWEGAISGTYQERTNRQILRNLFQLLTSTRLFTSLSLADSASQGHELYS